MAAIHAGKHVHFNKTMTVSTEEATIMIEEAKKYNVKLVSSPGQMTSPALRRMRKAILTGEIGIPSWTIGGSEGVLLWHCWQPNRDLGEGMPKIDPTWYFKQPAGRPHLGLHGLRPARHDRHLTRDLVCHRPLRPALPRL